MQLNHHLVQLQDALDLSKQPWLADLTSNTSQSLVGVSFRDPYPTDFVTWLRNSPRQPSKRHSDCGDVFRWAPFHAYWKERCERAYSAYLRWQERNSEWLDDDSDD